MKCFVVPYDFNYRMYLERNFLFHLISNRIAINASLTIDSRRKFASFL